MKTEYSVNLKAIFDDLTDRDVFYENLKKAISGETGVKEVSALTAVSKTANGYPLSIVITKNENIISENFSENI